MRLVAYCRYSSDMQRQESIDAQIRAITEYCEKNNHQLIKVYADEAKSATTADRPQFLQMIADSSTGEFNGVIVHKLDRFSRNRYDSAFYKRQLRINGVTLFSVLEHLDDSPESIILESLLEGMNEYYSKNLAREVLKGLKENAHQCKHTGGHPPLGYKVNPDKTYSIDLNEAQIVKTVFQTIIDGGSYNDAIRIATEKGFRTRRGNKLSLTNIHDMVRNEKYKGVYVYNRAEKKIAGKRNNHKSKPDEEIIRIPGGIPAIIDEETWNMANSILDERKRNRGNNGGKAAKRQYLLTGKVVCGLCGGPMIGNSRRSGTQKKFYRHYECQNRKKHKSCTQKAISADFLDNAVLNHIEEAVNDRRFIDKLSAFIKTTIKETGSDAELVIKQLKADKAKKEKEIENLVAAVASGITNKVIKDKLDLLESEIASLNLRISSAEIDAKKLNPSKEQIASYINKFKDIKEKPFEETKAMIGMLVHSVVVSDTDVQINIRTFDDFFPKQKSPHDSELSKIVGSIGGDEGI